MISIRSVVAVHKKAFIGIGIVILLVLIATVIRISTQNHNQKLPSGQYSNSRNTPTPSLTIQQTVGDSAVVSGTCTNNTNAVFTHDFTQPNLLKLIQPPVINATDLRDRAWPAIDMTKTDKVAIYAPADVKLTSGIYKIAHQGASTYDYDLWFELSCTRWFFINHVTNPVAKITQLFPSKPNVPTSGSATADRTPVNPPVSFTSGELIGYTSGTQDAHNFDLGVFDFNHTNVIPASFNTPKGSREYNFICPFDLFPSTIKATYYAILKTSPYEAGSLCTQ